MYVCTSLLVYDFACSLIYIRSRCYILVSAESLRRSVRSLISSSSLCARKGFVADVWEVDALHSYEHLCECFGYNVMHVNNQHAIEPIGEDANPVSEEGKTENANIGGEKVLLVDLLLEIQVCTDFLKNVYE